jgi:CheY-like chemotaxis protein
VLKEIGNHEVQVAYDGETGLKLAKQFHPELVLLDIGLPGIDGYEVARRLRGEPEGDRLLVAAVTGYGQEEDRRRSKEAGFDEHFLKPVALDAMRGLFHHPKLANHQVA